MALITKILVPVDFSTHSHRALDFACELSLRFSAPMVILHAYAVPVYPLPEGYLLASAEAAAEMVAKIQDGMTETKRLAQERGIATVDTVVVEGSAFTEIIRTARTENVDLIVMGTHGRTGLKHVLLGSVAEKVVRKAPCAVLTVREP